MTNFLSRRALTAGLIGLPAAALAPPATAKPEPVESERYLAFLQQEVRALLVERHAKRHPGEPLRDWKDTPFMWLPEGFEHPQGSPMERARAVLIAAQALS